MKEAVTANQRFGRTNTRSSPTSSPSEFTQKTLMASPELFFTSTNSRSQVVSSLECCAEPCFGLYRLSVGQYRVSSSGSSVSSEARRWSRYTWQTRICGGRRSFEYYMVESFITTSSRIHHRPLHLEQPSWSRPLTRSAGKPRRPPPCPSHFRLSYPLSL